MRQSRKRLIRACQPFRCRRRPGRRPLIRSASKAQRPNAGRPIYQCRTNTDRVDKSRREKRLGRPEWWHGPTIMARLAGHLATGTDNTWKRAEDTETSTANRARKSRHGNGPRKPSRGHPQEQPIGEAGSGPRERLPERERKELPNPGPGEPDRSRVQATTSDQKCRPPDTRHHATQIQMATDHEDANPRRGGPPRPRCPVRRGTGRGPRRRRRVGRPPGRRRPSPG